MELDQRSLHKNLETIAGYSDSNKLYDSLYKIYYKGIINDDTEDTSSNKSTLVYQKGNYGSAKICLHYVFSGGYPGQTVNVKIKHETRWGSDGVVKQDWKTENVYERTVSVDEWDMILKSGATNLYYHRFTVTDADTGEVYGVHTVYTPYR